MSKRLLGSVELNRIYQRDCIEGMRMLPDSSVVVITDFPYGTTHAKWDSAEMLDEWVKEINRVSINNLLITTASQPFTTDVINANRKHFRYDLVWDKGQGSDFLNAKVKPLKSHENILIFYSKKPTYNPQFEDGKPYQTTRGRKSELYGSDSIDEIITVSDGKRYPKSVLKFVRDKGKSHPTQKPLSLYEWIIKSFTNDGDIVLDPFMGSGTTAVACVNTGRHFIGFETEPKYIEIANKRLDSVEETRLDERSN